MIILLSWKCKQTDPEPVDENPEVNSMCVFISSLRLFLKQNEHVPSALETSSAQFVFMLHMNESIIGLSSHMFSLVVHVVFSDVLTVS